jgi:hypothetical protein
MWEPRYLTTLWAFTACYKDSCTFYFICLWESDLYRTGSLITIAREIAKNKLDLVRIQGVRWDRRGNEPAGDYTFFYGSDSGNHILGTGYFVWEEDRRKVFQNRLLRRIFGRDRGWGGMDWINLAQDREHSREHGNEPSGSTTCWEIFEQLSNWRILKGLASWS